MRSYKTQLRRLQRELERQQQAREGKPVHTIEVWNEDELREVWPLGAKVIAVVNVDMERL